MLKAFDAAGLGQIAFTETALTDAKERLPVVHYHFFTEDGEFGSLDEHENRVDEGTYKILNRNTFRIGHDPGVVFHYRIQRDALTFYPVITQEMRRKAFAHPQDSAAAWSLSVAYPGQVWTRAPCGGWC